MWLTISTMTMEPVNMRDSLVFSGKYGSLTPVTGFSSTVGAVAANSGRGRSWERPAARCFKLVRHFVAVYFQNETQLSRMFLVIKDLHSFHSSPTSLNLYIYRKHKKDFFKKRVEMQLRDLTSSSWKSMQSQWWARVAIFRFQNSRKVTAQKDMNTLKNTVPGWSNRYPSYNTRR